MDNSCNQKSDSHMSKLTVWCKHTCCLAICLSLGCNPAWIPTAELLFRRWRLLPLDHPVFWDPWCHNIQSKVYFLQEHNARWHRGAVPVPGVREGVAVLQLVAGEHGCQMVLAWFLARMCLALAPSGLKDYGSATLRCKMWSLPFLGFCQGGGRGSNFAIWQHCRRARASRRASATRSSWRRAAASATRAARRSSPRPTRLISRAQLITKKNTGWLWCQQLGFVSWDLTFAILPHSD